MATKIWIGTSTPGDYSVAANWAPSGVPGAAEDFVAQNAPPTLAAASGGDDRQEPSPQPAE